MPSTLRRTKRSTGPWTIYRGCAINSPDSAGVQISLVKVKPDRVNAVRVNPVRVNQASNRNPANSRATGSPVGNRVSNPVKKAKAASPGNRANLALKGVKPAEAKWRPALRAVA
jgi:hypothetical protein